MSQIMSVSTDAMSLDGLLDSVSIGSFSNTQSPQPTIPRTFQGMSANEKSTIKTSNVIANVFATPLIFNERHMCNLYEFYPVKNKYIVFKTILN